MGNKTKTMSPVQANRLHGLYLFLYFLFFPSLVCSLSNYTRPGLAPEHRCIQRSRALYTLLLLNAVLHDFLFLFTYVGV